ncbi:MAG: XdhC family protein [Candidatus Aminicenantales bacterium]
MKNIYFHLSELIRKEKVALATIIEAKGSTPQVQGASALFTSGGLIAGTLGGGLLEGNARRRAEEALKERYPLIYRFDLDARLTSREGAVCGGQAVILIDPTPEIHQRTFQRLHQSFLKRQPGILATKIEAFSDRKIFISRYWIEGEQESLADLEEPLSRYGEDMVETLMQRKPSLIKVRREKGKESLLFFEPVFPLPQLVIAGAGHIGRAVAHLGNLLNFEVIVIDDRTEYANRENIPDADRIIVGEMGKAVRNFSISSDTYVVIVTRGHQHDAEVLRQCIASDAAYIGMIGSARKIRLMKEKFLKNGWASSDQWDRVRAPIGLEIGSKTVEEIAVSIAAQLVQVRSRIHQERRKKE